MLIWERHLESQILTEEDSSELSGWYNFLSPKRALGPGGNVRAWGLANSVCSRQFLYSICCEHNPPSLTIINQGLIQFGTFPSSRDFLLCFSEKLGRRTMAAALRPSSIWHTLKQLLQSPDSCYVTKQCLPLYIRERCRERKGINFKINGESLHPESESDSEMNSQKPSLYPFVLPCWL